MYSRRAEAFEGYAVVLPAGALPRVVAGMECRMSISGNLIVASAARAATYLPGIYRSGA